MESTYTLVRRDAVVLLLVRYYFVGRGTILTIKKTNERGQDIVSVLLEHLKNNTIDYVSDLSDSSGLTMGKRLGTPILWEAFKCIPIRLLTAEYDVVDALDSDVDQDMVENDPNNLFTVDVKNFNEPNSDDGMDAIIGDLGDQATMMPTHCLSEDLLIMKPSNQLRKNCVVTLLLLVDVVGKGIIVHLSPCGFWGTFPIPDNMFIVVCVTNIVVGYGFFSLLHPTASESIIGLCIGVEVLWKSFACRPMGITTSNNFLGGDDNQVEENLNDSGGVSSSMVFKLYSMVSLLVDNVVIGYGHIKTLPPVGKWNGIPILDRFHVIVTLSHVLPDVLEHRSSLEHEML